MDFKLVQHLVVNIDGSLPEITNCLYAYVMAGNGILVYAKRKGLEVLIPVSPCKIAGLPELSPKVHLTKPVSAVLLDNALRLSQRAFPNEMLFWFHWNDEWSIHVPDQQITNTSTVPCDRHDQAGTSALLDLHSHGGFAPFFSITDDRDEVGFRIYAVIGHVNTAPTIAVRVGVYSHYFNIPASIIFELPDGIQDLYEQEEMQNEVE